MPENSANETTAAPTEVATVPTPVEIPAAPKPLTAVQVAAQRLKEQQDENAAASLTYKAQIGKKFTDGKRVATIKGYVPSRLTKDGPRQQFLVNFGNPNCSFFYSCAEFILEFKTEVTGEAPTAQPATTLLPK